MEISMLGRQGHLPVDKWHDGILGFASAEVILCICFVGQT